MLCCVGAVANVLMMISANLVGFALGLDGLEVILKSILHDWSGEFEIFPLLLAITDDYQAFYFSLLHAHVFL